MAMLSQQEWHLECKTPVSLIQGDYFLEQVEEEDRSRNQLTQVHLEMAIKMEEIVSSIKQKAARIKKNC